MFSIYLYGDSAKMVMARPKTWQSENYLYQFQKIHGKKCYLCTVFRQKNSVIMGTGAGQDIFIWV